MHRFVNLWTFLVLLGLTMAFFLVIFPRLGKHYPAHTFDRRSGRFRPSEAEGILKTFKDAGQLDNYLRQEWIDLIFPLVYGAMLMIPILGLGPKVGAPRWLIVLPILAMIGDWVENVSVIGMIVRYRDHGTVPYALAVAACIGGRVKGLCLIASALVGIGLAGWWLVRRR